MSADTGQRAGLLERLGPRLADARANWPGISISDAEFVAHVAEKLTEAERRGEISSRDIDGGIQRLRLDELLLACACARGNAVAIAFFESGYFDEIEAACRRFPSLPLPLDDLRQRVRAKLFLEVPPALAGYAGVGQLRSWLRALVVHMLLNITTRESREVPTDETFFAALVDADPSSEVACVKNACRADFERAFQVALARLSAREKSLLRYAFADGLNVDAIGKIFQVHRATAARWVQKARERLTQETRVELVQRLKITDAEAASLVRSALSGVGTTFLERLR